MSELPRGSRIGSFPYRIVERLRLSKMSEVYLASLSSERVRDHSTLVILKIALSETHNYLENEVERLRRLRHSGIVRLYPIAPSNVAYVARTNLSGERCFFVMEYLAGGSLKELLRQRKTLDIKLALRIAQRLAETLAYLADNHQVHMDLKPDNVLFRRTVSDGVEPEPVLIDFGIARDIGQPGLEARALPFCAPERIMAQKGTAPPETAVRPHPSMDVYALGLILYQMVTGRTPFEGRSHQSLTTAILEGNPTEPRQLQPAVNPDLNDLILAMIAREPGTRPDAVEVGRRLDELRSQYRVPDTTPGSGSEPNPTGNRSFWQILRNGVLAILLLVVLSESAYWVYSSGAWKPALGWVQALVARAAVPGAAQSPSIASTQDASQTPSGTGQNGQTGPASTIVIDAMASQTPILASTSTPIPTILRPTVAATPRSTARPVQTPSPVISTVDSALRVSLSAPANDASGNGKQTFAWSPDFALGPDETFEITFYRAGQDPFVDGFGIAAPVRQNSLTVDLDVVDRTPGHPLQAGQYLWGVRLYRGDQKVKFFGSRTFTFSP